MEDNSIDIVTAFFPLNRERWDGFERNNDKYIEYFKFWAQINNKLVVYTTEEFSEKVKEIRKDKPTKIITIDDYRSIDTELYNSIKDASSNKLNKEFHIRSA